MKLSSHFISCVVLIVCCGVAEAGRKPKSHLVCVCCPCPGIVPEYSGEPAGQFKVFVADSDSAPAAGMFLIGPDGQKKVPDANGIATVPFAWNQKLISVRNSVGREIRTVQLNASADAMFRINTSSDDGGVDEADTPSDAPTCPAVARRILLREAIRRLEASHNKLNLEDDFTITPPDISPEAEKACLPEPEEEESSDGPLEA